MTFIWALFVLTVTFQPITTHRLSGNLVKKVFNSLEKLVTFFGEEHCHVNLDGIYGLRAAEGQLWSILQHYHNLQNSDPVFWREIEILTLIASKAGNDSLPCLKKSNPAYYKILHPVAEKPFIIDYIPRHNRPQYVASKGIATGDVYDETKGDQCFTDLLGTGKHPKCTISQSCWEMMTKFDDELGGYKATHDLLYFILIEHLNCRVPGTSEYQQQKIEDIQQYLCNVIYGDAIIAAKNNHVDIGLQDLFLEQGLLCGMLGFEDFMKADWLNMILSWQDEDLCCFTDNNRHKDGTRKLLVEQELEDGCLSHKTGLATGLLGVYLRCLIKHGGHFPQES